METTYLVDSMYDESFSRSFLSLVALACEFECSDILLPPMSTSPKRIFSPIFHAVMKKTQRQKMFGKVPSGRSLIRGTMQLIDAIGNKKEVIIKLFAIVHFGSLDNSVQLLQVY